MCGELAGELAVSPYERRDTRTGGRSLLATARDARRTGPACVLSGQWASCGFARGLPSCLQHLPATTPGQATHPRASVSTLVTWITPGPCGYNETITRLCWTAGTWPRPQPASLLLLHCAFCAGTCQPLRRALHVSGSRSASVVPCSVSLSASSLHALCFISLTRICAIT